MAMKSVKLLAPMGFGFKKSLLFKWQWRVEYEMHDGGQWRKCYQMFESRSAAREFIRKRKYRTWQRRFITQRRLAQTSWETY